MQAIVRPAAAADAPAIAAVGGRSFTWAFGHLFTPEVLGRYLAQTYSVAKIRSSQSKPEHLYYVAEAEGTILGFLKLKRNCPHPALTGRQWQLQKLYVEPDRTRHGIGLVLMAEGERAWGAEGAACTWLLVYAGNERAHAFYRRFGFLPAGSEVHDFEHIRVEFRLLVKRYTAGPALP
jgi:ribosomal protein S18 acetylase RimI-like enzyme